MLNKLQGWISFSVYVRYDKELVSDNTVLWVRLKTSGSGKPNGGPQ